MIREVGWCDQQSYLMMTLLNKIGIMDTRLRDVQNHTVMEVKKDDKWLIIDPFTGLFFTNTEGEMVVIEELQYSEIQDKRQILKAMEYLQVDDRYLNYSEVYIGSDVRWMQGIGPTFSKQRGFDNSKSILEWYASLNYRYLGDKYYYWLQDLNLNKLLNTSLPDQGVAWIAGYSDNFEENDDAFSIFFEARNYDVVGRDEEAKVLYKKITEEYPDSYWSLEAEYFDNVNLFEIEFTNLLIKIFQSLKIQILHVRK